MAKTIEQIRQELDDKIPRDAVSQRKAGNNRSLSYLEGWYVINRLNEIFGQGNWQYESDPPVKVFETEVTNSSGQQGRGVSYTALVTLTVRIGDESVAFTDIGAGKGIDYNSGLEADESAVKEAVTDGIKRCAKSLGMSLGLALYDKSQENVDSGEEKPRSGAANHGRTATNGAGNGAGSKVSADSKAKPASEEKASVGTQERGGDQAIPSTPPEDRETLNQMLSAMSKVIVQKRKSTVTDILAGMKKKYNTDRKEELTLEQAKTFYGELRGMIA